MSMLIFCEESGTLRDRFIDAGYDCYSADLKPGRGIYTSRHVQGDTLYLLRQKWDGVIAHPPCTRLCNSGVLRLYKDGKKVNGIDAVKWQEMEEGAAFFSECLKANTDHLAVENPIQHGYATRIIGSKFSQIVQPWQFSDDASKATALWLKGLPLLKPTGYCEPRLVNGKKRWANQTPAGHDKLGPSEERGALRAVTYPGIADAMVDQWGPYFVGK